MIKGDEGTDADYQPLPPREIVETDKKGKRKAKNTIDKARKAEETRQGKHVMAVLLRSKWYNVEPENIIGFEVWVKSATDAGQVGLHDDYNLLTCLILIADDANILSKYVDMLNDVHYSNTLMMALTQRGQLEHGHGILMYGQLLEVYELVNGQVNAEGDSFMKLATSDNGEGDSGLSVDLSEQPPDFVTSVLKIFKQLVLRKGAQHAVKPAIDGQDADAEGEDDDDGQVPVTPVTDREMQDLIMADA